MRFSQVRRDACGIGHFDGWTELDPTTNPDALMALTLGTGQRRIQDIDAVFAAGL